MTAISTTESLERHTTQQKLFLILCPKIGSRGNQKSFSTPILDVVDRLAKGTQLLVHTVAYLTNDIRDLQDANIALSKGLRAKKTHLRQEGQLNLQDSKLILEEETKGKLIAAKIYEGSSNAFRSGPSI
ncbi:hypothetical protein GcC1_042005 [Golovinomyces cichoracearum]|uniref:Uncharacterized protein n=1 Tax=Golovinomyces cichoracearum TaxID=62708 RepID=A0A420IZ90_9PEZI|nr:hypothetical protein GcC1_042005 [Golovinomyces cichoracearum]